MLRSEVCCRGWGCTPAQPVHLPSLRRSRPPPILARRPLPHPLPAVDLAAEQGGNIETTVAGQVAKHGAVTCIGYTDMPSRLPAQSSTLFSNNISKFLLSMGPFTGHKETFLVDHKDDAVRWGWGGLWGGVPWGGAGAVGEGCGGGCGGGGGVWKEASGRAAAPCEGWGRSAGGRPAPNVP